MRSCILNFLRELCKQAQSREYRFSVGIATGRVSVDGVIAEACVFGTGEAMLALTRDGESATCRLSETATEVEALAKIDECMALLEKRIKEA